MTDRELMQKALEALEPYAILYGHIQQVVTALRERLAQPETVMAEYKFQTYAAYKTDGEMQIGVVPEQEQAPSTIYKEPEQEPVAWGVFDGPNLHDTFFTEDEAHEMVRLKGDGSIVKPLYTAPPKEKNT